MGKQIASVSSETQLPAAMIDHIQSFLNGRQAALTSLLSRSWRDAWLTRSSLDFDEEDFTINDISTMRIAKGFAEFTTKTMERYRDKNRTIRTFKLRTITLDTNVQILARNLTLKAIETGATDLNIDLRYCFRFSLPEEVFGSKKLTRLWVSKARIDGRYAISCSSLKSLVLNRVYVESVDVIRDIISSCVSIEELSLLDCFSMYPENGGILASSDMNLEVLKKLKSLSFKNVVVDNSFFNDMSTRFRWLRDLSLDGCVGYTSIEIASTSLERMSFAETNILRGKFDVPNIRKFGYSGPGLPRVSFKPVASREWESELTLTCNRVRTSFWFFCLNKVIRKLSTSRISLTLNVRGKVWKRVEIGGVPKAAEVDNLAIDAPPTLGHAVLHELSWACGSKILTKNWETDNSIMSN